jgi:hypothetical protein
MLQGLDSVENLTERHLHTEETAAPMLCVALDDSNDVLCIYVIGDNTKIFAQTSNIFDSLVLLMACYYVFDLAYPSPYAQFLGLLQHWGIGDPFTESKVGGWVKFSDILARHCED